MIDDFYNILTSRRPTAETLSREGHFSGCLLSTLGAPAVHRTENMHRFVSHQTPSGRSVRVVGGICQSAAEDIVGTALKEQNISMFSLLPPTFTNLVDAVTWYQTM